MEGPTHIFTQLQPRLLGVAYRMIGMHRAKSQLREERPRYVVSAEAHQT